MADQYTFEENLLDESFNPQDTLNYGLGILLSGQSISFCTLDFRRNKFLGLHRFVRNEVKPPDGQSGTGPSFADFLHHVRTVTPWLKNSFKIVKIAYDGKKSTLVPALLFNPDEKDQYLVFNYKRDKDELVFCDHLMPLDAWQVFAVPEPVMAATNGIFPKSKVVHASSLLIESIWINYKNRINSPHVFLHLREPLFDLMIFDGRQMIYFNTFSFLTPEDVTYYLIFVLEQLNFNPETIPLVLLGNYEPGDGLSELLPRYVRNVETGRRNESYRYSYMLNQLPSHTFFPLLNFFSCGL